MSSDFSEFPCRVWIGCFSLLSVDSVELDALFLFLDYQRMDTAENGGLGASLKRKFS